MRNIDFPTNNDNYPLYNYVLINDKLINLNDTLLFDDNKYMIEYSLLEDNIIIYLPESMNNLRWVVDSNCTDIIKSNRILVNEKNMKKKENHHIYKCSRLREIILIFNLN